eukprot:s10520_g2.t1
MYVCHSCWLQSPVPCVFCEGHRMQMATLRSALRSSLPLVDQAIRPNTSLQLVRNFATTKAASPETPLMHYKATQQATSSINHRIFYVNVVAMVLVYDLGSSMLDF